MMNVNRIDGVGSYKAGSVKGSSGTGGFSEILGSKMSESETDLDRIFSAASSKYGVPLNLLKAVAKAESGFDPNATSHCGAMGIMQLMPGTAASLGVTNAYDPEQNIMGGAKYLSQMLSEFGGSTQLAVAAYNAGPGSVSKYGGIPPYEETQTYVERVLGYCGLDISAGKVSSTVRAVSSPRVSSSDGLARAKIADALDEMSDEKRLSTELMLSIYQMQMQLFEDMGK